MTECFVSAHDYAIHWKGKAIAPTPIYVGPERRRGPRDRRTPNHERRWDASLGRRYAKIKDRRRHA